ncbi:hypothetical protein BDV98DRAFT_583279 [Pterulicium gracile]|uniref:Uncharacterized protein n=1 Tax=Pterulicium gracile TaxID=1884261 RepID=A0A5C3QGJ9_9AGAR|nr:hypothetical protein BDV98DRAFT_583279 [Pterula gracilis]
MQSPIYYRFGIPKNTDLSVHVHDQTLAETANSSTPFVHCVAGAWTASSSLRGKIRDLTEQVTERLALIISTVDRRVYLPLCRILTETKSKVNRIGLGKGGEHVQVEGGKVEEIGGASHPASSPTLQRREAMTMSQQGDELDAHMFRWLYEVSSHPSVKAVISSAVSDLRIGYPAVAMDILRNSIFRQICAEIKACTVPGPGDRRVLQSGLQERWLHLCARTFASTAARSSIALALTGAHATGASHANPGLMECREK